MPARKNRSDMTAVGLATMTTTLLQEPRRPPILSLLGRLFGPSTYHIPSFQSIYIA
jgi:hypothetical protein